MLCYNCENTSFTETGTTLEVLSIDGELVQVHINVSKCDVCGAIYLTDNQANALIQATIGAT